MSIFVALHHVTHYKYDRPVDIGPQTIRLRPAPHTRTPILSYSLKVTPANHFINWQQDPQGNWLARFVFPEKAEELKIEVDFTAAMTVINPFDFFVDPRCEHLPFDYGEQARQELREEIRKEAVRKFKDKLSALHKAEQVVSNLKREIADRLVERLDDVKRSFALALDLGCHGDELATALGGRASVGIRRKGRVHWTSAKCHCSRWSLSA